MYLDIYGACVYEFSCVCTCVSQCVVCVCVWGFRGLTITLYEGMPFLHVTDLIHVQYSVCVCVWDLVLYLLLYLLWWGGLPPELLTSLKFKGVQDALLCVVLLLSASTFQRDFFTTTFPVYSNLLWQDLKPNFDFGLMCLWLTSPFLMGGHHGPLRTSYLPPPTLLLQWQQEQGIRRQGALSLLSFSWWSWHGMLWSLRRQRGGRRY